LDGEKEFSKVNLEYTKSGLYAFSTFHNLPFIICNKNGVENPA
jgi:hypothetical protein